LSESEEFVWVLLLAAWKWTVALLLLIDLKAIARLLTLDIAIDKCCDFVKFMLAESVYRGY